MSEDVAVEKSQYLTFTLDKEQYAIDVAKVKEVLEYSTVTKVPRTPLFMRGVINLRGSVVPVVDLRMKFDMGETEKTISTSIIVVEVIIEGETVVIGTLADSVQEVINLDRGQIEPTPQIGTKIDADFIEGIGKQDGRFIMILDIDRVFTESDLQQLDRTAI
ncbi:MAG TPA: chemotaxis protein CheW [Spirochaetia bacterium]|nr:chemotaxis protein CheW [Spirochaetia bacterium]